MDNRYLFRGKQIGNEKFVVGFYDIISKGAYLDPIQNGHYITTFEELGNGEIILNWRYEIDPKTVGQCTGLKDKNDKLIFEGDILKNTSNPSWKLQLVRYGYCKSWVVDDFTDRQANKKTFSQKKCCYITASDIIYEIIGNIHDNPELLEGSNG